MSLAGMLVSSVFVVVRDCFEVARTDAAIGPAPRDRNRSC
jgi:hypothetical protein